MPGYKRPSPWVRSQGDWLVFLESRLDPRCSQRDCLTAGVIVRLVDQLLMSVVAIADDPAWGDYVTKPPVCENAVPARPGGVVVERWWGAKRLVHCSPCRGVCPSHIADGASVRRQPTCLTVAATDIIVGDAVVRRENTAIICRHWGW